MLILFISFVIWVVISLFTLLLLERIPHEFMDVAVFVLKLAGFALLLILLAIVISISFKPVLADIAALVEFGASLI